MSSRLSTRLRQMMNTTVFLAGDIVFEQKFTAQAFMLQHRHCGTKPSLVGSLVFTIVRRTGDASLIKVQRPLTCLQLQNNEILS
jgi:hypothetical protein